MKRIAVSVIVLVLLFGTGVCFADSSIPNMVGTWKVTSEAGFKLHKGTTPGVKTHHSEEFSNLSAEAVVTKQKGRIFHGTFTSKKASENFVGAIGLDNKTIYYADEDGYAEGKLVDKGKIDIIYRQASSTDTVVAVGVWIRK